MIVHVNMSVPVACRGLGSRFPMELNSVVYGISANRSSVAILLKPGDPWNGPVIVKSDLNFGGETDRVSQHIWRNRARRVTRKGSGSLRRLGVEVVLAAAPLLCHQDSHSPLGTRTRLRPEKDGLLGSGLLRALAQWSPRDMMWFAPQRYRSRCAPC